MTVDGMTTTSNTGSPLVTYARAARKKKKPRNFIKGAIKHPGALHRALGVPQGQTIPPAKVAAAAASDNPDLRRKAQFARTLGKLSKKK
jgi:hypothetical protein